LSFASAIVRAVAEAAARGVLADSKEDRAAVHHHAAAHRREASSVSAVDVPAVGGLRGGDGAAAKAGGAPASAKRKRDFADNPLQEVDGETPVASPPPAPAVKLLEQPRRQEGKEPLDSLLSGVSSRRAAAAAAPAAAPAPPPPAETENEPAAEKAEKKDAGRMKKGRAEAPEEQLARRADQLFAAQRFDEAAVVYQDLLRRYPEAAAAPRWRVRVTEALRAAAVAAEGAASGHEMADEAAPAAADKAAAKKAAPAKPSKGKPSSAVDSLDGL
jgi:hypothetical protein